VGARNLRSVIALSPCDLLAHRRQRDPLTWIPQSHFVLGDSKHHTVLLRNDMSRWLQERIRAKLLT